MTDILGKHALVPYGKRGGTISCQRTGTIGCSTIPEECANAEKNLEVGTISCQRTGTIGRSTVREECANAEKNLEVEDIC